MEQKSGRGAIGCAHRMPMTAVHSSAAPRVRSRKRDGIRRRLKSTDSFLGQPLWARRSRRRIARGFAAEPACYEEKGRIASHKEQAADHTSVTQISMTSHPAPRGRIFIDVGTSLAWRDRPAVGIVRAEREILARLLDDPNLAVIPVVIHDGTFRAIDPQLARSLAAPIRALRSNRRRPSFCRRA